MTQISRDGNKSSPDRGQGVFVLVFFFSPELTYSGWTFFSQYSPIKMATL